MKKNNFLELIKDHRDSKVEDKFEGTFLDYLNLVSENPDLVKSSHKRLSLAIESYGVRNLSEEDDRTKKIFDGDSIKVYDYFQNEFFGHEKVIYKIMRFLKSAALRGEESRQVLLLMGPVGAGKSALTEHVKGALEQLPYYHLKGDPQRGEPLQLLPRSLRKTFEEKLGVKIEGDISPVARHVLLDEYGGKYENFEVQKNFVNFYGWDIFEKEKGYNLFIGFDNSKIIGCYITLDSLDKENSSNFLYNSCLNIVKKLF